MFDLEKWISYFLINDMISWKKHLRIDRNYLFGSFKITSIRLYTPGNPRSASGLRKGVYNLTEVILNEPNK
jgi:hypothetical protein